MTIFATILKIFGCSGSTKKNDKNTSEDTLNAQITKSIEDFKNRPVHKNLTEKIIDTLSDDELLQVIFDNLIERLPKDYTKEYETVLTWTKPRQAIYVIWCLEAEVNNGGYNQFYFNSSGKYYKLLPDALKLVCANKFADLTSRANKIYEQENAKITKYQDGTLEGFSKSYDDNPLNKFDDEFYDLYKTEDLQKKQVDYIRKNKTEFIDN